MASALLFGFVTANAFAWVCLVTMPATPSDAASMADCDMDMPDAEGIGLRAASPCCLSCVADAGLLTAHGFELPPAVPVPTVLDAGFREFVLPALGEPAGRVVPPEASPPVFLLTGSLLI